jgi:hypothetical protein
MRTYFINFIGGPGVGKSTMTAALFVEFKKHNQMVDPIEDCRPLGITESSSVDPVKDCHPLGITESSSVEIIWEVGKKYVWMGDIDTLNDEHLLAMKQLKLFREINSKVRFVITDGSILHGLYYNRHNPDNISNREKTEEYIIKHNAEFNHINIYLNKGSYAFETVGRLFDESESAKIHLVLKDILTEKHIPFMEMTSDLNLIPEIYHKIMLMVDPMV